MSAAEQSGQTQNTEDAALENVVKTSATEEATKSSKKRRKPMVTEGKIFIQTTSNNAIVTITDMHGNTIAWSSTVSAGSLRSQKKTPFAAGLAVDQGVRKGMEKGLKEAIVLISGAGLGREMALKKLGSFTNEGLHITAIIDNTGIPHNGCRPKKKRRV